MQSLGQSKRSRGWWYGEMGHREAVAYNKRRQPWETQCMVKVPVVRQGKKFTVVFLIKLTIKRIFKN